MQPKVPNSKFTLQKLDELRVRCDTMDPDPFTPDSWWFVPWLVATILSVLAVGLPVLLVFVVGW